jgi:hypothetical protein
MPVIKLPTGSYYFSGRLIRTYDSRWPDEPLSAEKLCADPHYRQWAVRGFGLRSVARSLIESWSQDRRQHNKANPKNEVKYTREQMIDKAAQLLGVTPAALTNLINRSAKVARKRR